ncbi:hypothetical protein [Pseudomonas fluorescens]|uniref:hypothetical protein n=1 Tax=Pseudomonas fluorescens TaxID=294 RepID=UPI0004BE3FA8|nr:hypothetical protein [Pseudomonas fluorescens]
MLKLTEGEKHYLLEMRALSVDAQGRDIFVGLTSEESERYHFLSNPHFSASYDEKDEYLALDQKHERARRDVLDAEHVKRTEAPSIH